MIKNRTIFTGDNLDILRGMDSESIDLVYLDPPFNSNRHYSAPIGSKAAGAEFKDAWTFEDTDAAWWGELSEDHPGLWSVINAAGVVGGKGDKSYLIYMAMRILELRRVLKKTGSIFLHCDSTMSHSLKMMMDAIFEKNNFRNEIIWHYDGPQRPSKKNFGSKHDVIFRYSMGKDYFSDPDGIAPPQVLTPEELKKYKKNADGKYFYDLPTGDYTQESIKKLDKEKRIRWTSGGKPRVMYYLERNKQGDYFRKKQLHDVWEDIISLGHAGGSEKTGYPTQKPLELLKRIILASCPADGIILDPFCGCATTCIASEGEGRSWIGIDISEKAVELVKLRAEGRFSLFPVIHRTDIPKRNAPPRSKDIKHTLYGKQEGICRGCKCYFEFRNFEIDHIIARNKGGIDSNGNLQLLCGHCNRVKSDKPMEYLLAEIAKRK